MKHCSIIISHFAQVDTFGSENYHGQGIRGKLLRECFESLKKTIDYPAEIIVVDNGGNPDETEYLVQETRNGFINTLIRNKNNMGFAYAWNQGARLATGDYLCFTCNDIKFYPEWLSTCIGLIEKYQSKYLVTPFINWDKNNKSCNKGMIDGNRLNSMAGSNCMLMDYETYRQSGEFPQHRVGGSIWQRRMIRKGYLVVIPPQNLAEHIGESKGIDFRQQFEVTKVLYNLEKINFNYKYDNPHIDYYFGFQKISGCPLGEKENEENVLKLKKPENQYNDSQVISRDIDI